LQGTLGVASTHAHIFISWGGRKLAAISFRFGRRGTIFCSFGFVRLDGFDYLWWVLSAWVTIRMLKSGDQRWWLALGAVVGM
jgi:hypothetical protein